MQLTRIATAGTAAEQALLADVTAKNPDASYVDVLLRFKVRRRRWALVALVASVVCCIMSAARGPLGAAVLEPDRAASISTGTKRRRRGRCIPYC